MQVQDQRTFHPKMRCEKYTEKVKIGLVFSFFFFRVFFRKRRHGYRSPNEWNSIYTYLFLVAWCRQNVRCWYDRTRISANKSKHRKRKNINFSWLLTNRKYLLLFFHNEIRNGFLLLERVTVIVARNRQPNNQNTNLSKSSSRNV